MRNGTKLGLILIGLTWLAASTAVSAHFVTKAQTQVDLRNSFTDPLRACVRGPADAIGLPTPQRRA